ncbi:hypothetical protein J6590_033173 [Homalodisca vitripennis]|nr:hypothetical protein J6590_033173 [Homalodisca vitripennis]
MLSWRNLTRQLPHYNEGVYRYERNRAIVVKDFCRKPEQHAGYESVLESYTTVDWESGMATTRRYYKLTRDTVSLAAGETSRKSRTYRYCREGTGDLWCRNVADVRCGKDLGILPHLGSAN